jgi:hypothetical protein
VTARLSALVGWLLAGHLLLAGLYWALLHVPESNVFMLGTSLLIVLAGIWLTGFVEGTGLLVRSREATWVGSIATAARRAALVVMPLIILAAVWWATSAVNLSAENRSGEMDAWIIAKTGVTKTSWLHAAIGWVIAFVRYTIGLSCGLALLGALMRDGIRGAASTAWLKRSFGWVQLAVISVCLLAGFWLPWKAADWRPASLPPTWAEPAFATVKLLVLFVIANVAWALVLWWVGHPAKEKAPAVPGALSAKP